MHTLVHRCDLATPSSAGCLGRLPAAETGESLAGQTIGEDGRWHGDTQTTEVSAVRGLYPIRLPAYSAALIKL